MIENQKHYQKHQHFIAFFIALTVLISGAYSVYRHYDFSYSEDAHSYVSMAQWNYKNISMTHQYRFIEPTIAGVIALPINSVYDKIWTERGGIEWSVRLAFFLENVLLMAFFGMMLFRIARHEGIDFWFAILAMLFLLTTRWGIDNAGLPVVEALYLLTISLLAYSLQTDNFMLQIGVIFIGCFAKEAFAFEIPVLLLFSNHRKKLILPLLLTGIAVWTSRYMIDETTGNNYSQEIANFTRHFKNIQTNFIGALKPKGWFETFSAVGLGGVLMGYAAWNKAIRAVLKREIPTWAWAIGVAAIIQGLLGEWGRMLYYACPLYVLIMGKTLQIYKSKIIDYE